MCGKEPPPRSSLENRQAVNRSTAQFIPLLLTGIIGYATWVVVVLVCTHYLLKPGPGTNVSARPGAAIAIVTTYFILLFPTAVTYFRILHVVHTNTGFVPPGTPTEGIKTRFDEEFESGIQLSCTRTTVAEPPASGAQSTGSDGVEKPGRGLKGLTIHMLDHEGIFRGDIPPPRGTEVYYSKEVFACDSQGLPIWCGICCNWKPDRSHHCSDVGRCVMKLDHFCPWVGGVVCETNFKFFVQFNFFASLYTLFILIVMAFFVAEIHRKSANPWNVHWIVALALAALFFLFTGGMAGKSMQDVLNNLTTIDAIDQPRRTMFLAVHVDQPSPSSASPPPVPWQGTITYPLYTKPSSSSSSEDASVSAKMPPLRTFAIIRTPPGTNPWNLGAYGNFRSVMGKTWHEWLLPLRYSPCCDHDRGDNIYELGREMEQLKKDAGITVEADRRGLQSRSSERRRRRKPKRRPSMDSLQSMDSTLAAVNGASGLDSRHRNLNVDDETEDAA